MRHLRDLTQLLAGKVGGAVIGTAVAVGAVAMVQQVPVELDASPTAVEGEDGEVDDGADDGADDGSDDDGASDDGALDDGAPDDGAPDDGSDDGDADDLLTDDDGADDDGADDDGTVTTTEVEDDAEGGPDRGRGSATSERVHAALVDGADVRPGDPGWGEAVSRSARAGGHGQRVSEAARGGRGGGVGQGSEAGASAERRGGPANGNGKAYGHAKRDGGEHPGRGAGRDR